METMRPGPQLLIERASDDVRIALEKSDTNALELVSWCLERLAKDSSEPDQVRLVLSGDFVASVRDRFEDTPGASQYTIMRGSGIVGGKTIACRDGHIDVLLHAGFFMALDEGADSMDTIQLIRRTVAHEAQHVVMHQRESSFQEPPIRSLKAANLESAALAIIEEYRAELGVELELREGDARWDPLQILDDLSAGLGIAVAEYQFHLEVERLIFDVGASALVAWKSLAYQVAEERIMLGEHRSNVRATQDKRWAKLIGPHWDEFIDLLGSLGAGTAKTAPAELTSAASALAQLLDEWLLTLGFRWTDTPNGSSHFAIEQWYFEEPDFLAALEHMSGQSPRS